MTQINNISQTIVKVCDKHGALIKEEILAENRCCYCRREKNSKWRNENREKHRASASTARNANKPLRNLKQREHRLKHNEEYRAREKLKRAKQGQRRNLLEVCRRRGIKEEQFNLMMKNQNGLCAICGKPETRKSRTSGKTCSLAIDHCHATNKVRALLCHSCNIAIGAFNDDVEVLKNAIAYLEHHRRTHH